MIKFRAVCLLGLGVAAGNVSFALNDDKPKTEKSVLDNWLAPAMFGQFYGAASNPEKVVDDALGSFSNIQCNHFLSALTSNKKLLWFKNSELFPEASRKNAQTVHEVLGKFKSTSWIDKDSLNSAAAFLKKWRESKDAIADIDSQTCKLVTTVTDLMRAKIGAMITKVEWYRSDEIRTWISGNRQSAEMLCKNLLVVYRDESEKSTFKAKMEEFFGSGCTYEDREKDVFVTQVSDSLNAANEVVQNSAAKIIGIYVTVVVALSCGTYYHKEIGEFISKYSPSVGGFVSSPTSGFKPFSDAAQNLK